MGFLWDFDRISMEVLWEFDCVSKGCLWDFHWIPMGSKLFFVPAVPHKAMAEVSE